MFTVYILYSTIFNKTYVGFTSDLEARFKSHNELGITGWAIKFRPWQIIYTEIFELKKEANESEEWFKTGAGREFIKTKLLNR